MRGTELTEQQEELQISITQSMPSSQESPTNHNIINPEDLPEEQLAITRSRISKNSKGNHSDKLTQSIDGL